jgi:hypothetical protein
MPGRLQEGARPRRFVELSELSHACSWARIEIGRMSRRRRCNAEDTLRRRAKRQRRAYSHRRPVVTVLYARGATHPARRAHWLRPRASTARPNSVRACGASEIALRDFRGFGAEPLVTFWRARAEELGVRAGSPHELLARRTSQVSRAAASRR